MATKRSTRSSSRFAARLPTSIGYVMLAFIVVGFMVQGLVNTLPLLQPTMAALSLPMRASVHALPYLATSAAAFARTLPHLAASSIEGAANASLAAYLTATGALSAAQASTSALCGLAAGRVHSIAATVTVAGWAAVAAAAAVWVCVKLAQQLSKGASKTPSQPAELPLKNEETPTATAACKVSTMRVSTATADKGQADSTPVSAHDVDEASFTIQVGYMSDASETPVASPTSMPEPSTQSEGYLSDVAYFNPAFNQPEPSTAQEASCSAASSVPAALKVYSNAMSFAGCKEAPEPTPFLRQKLSQSFTQACPSLSSAADDAPAAPTKAPARSRPAYDSMGFDSDSDAESDTETDAPTSTTCWEMLFNPAAALGSASTNPLSRCSSAGSSCPAPAEACSSSSTPVRAFRKRWSTASGSDLDASTSSSTLSRCSSVGSDSSDALSFTAGPAVLTTRTNTVLPGSTGSTAPERTRKKWSAAGAPVTQAFGPLPQAPAKPPTRKAALPPKAPSVLLPMPCPQAAPSFMRPTASSQAKVAAPARASGSPAAAGKDGRGRWQ